MVAVAAAGIAFPASVSQAQVLVADLLDQPLTETSPSVGANDGTISSWVVSDPALNPSGYIYIYQVVNAGPDTVTAIEVNGFAGVFLAGASTLNPPVGLPGALTPGGANVSPNSLTPITPEGSADFIASLPSGPSTNATFSGFFDVFVDISLPPSTNYALVKDNFTGYGKTLAPNGMPVPEASTMTASALMLLPLGIAAFRAVRRQRAD